MKKMDEFYQSIGVIIRKQLRFRLSWIFNNRCLISCQQSGWIVETVSLIIFASSSGLAALVGAINGASETEIRLNFAITNYSLRIIVVWILLKI